MNNDYIKGHIIVPALTAIGSYSRDATDLIFNTGCAESLYLTRTQLGGGPALGFWQMEPATHNDIFKNYLGGSNKDHLLTGLRFLSEKAGDPHELMVNDWYAAAMCRIHYLRVRENIPEANNVIEQAKYWKKYYNTENGSGTVEHFIKAVAAKNMKE